MKKKEVLSETVVDKADELMPQESKGKRIANANVVELETLEPPVEELPEPIEEETDDEQAETEPVDGADSVQDADEAEGTERPAVDEKTGQFNLFPDDL